MKRYRVRQGSIIDYGRIALASAAFWAMMIMAAVSAYPM